MSSRLKLRKTVDIVAAVGSEARTGQPVLPPAHAAAVSRDNVANRLVAASSNHAVMSSAHDGGDEYDDDGARAELLDHKKATIQRSSTLPTLPPPLPPAPPHATSATTSRHAVKLVRTPPQSVDGHGARAPALPVIVIDIDDDDDDDGDDDHENGRGSGNCVASGNVMFVSASVLASAQESISSNAVCLISDDENDGGGGEREDIDERDHKIAIVSDETAAARALRSMFESPAAAHPPLRTDTRSIDDLVSALTRLDPLPVIDTEHRCACAQCCTSVALSNRRNLCHFHGSFFGACASAGSAVRETYVCVARVSSDNDDGVLGGDDSFSLRRGLSVANGAQVDAAATRFNAPTSTFGSGGARVRTFGSPRFKK